MAFRVGTSEDSGNLSQEDVYRLKRRIQALRDIEPPVGSVMPLSHIYYSGDSNNTPLGAPEGNTAAAINAWLALPEVTDGKWVVCDGSAPNDPESPIWNTGTKHVPNLTNSRFLMGDTAMGSLGGADQHNTANTGYSVNAGVTARKANFTNCTQDLVFNATNDKVNFYIPQLNAYVNSHSHNMAHTHVWATKESGNAKITYTFYCPQINTGTPESGDPCIAQWTCRSGSNRTSKYNGNIANINNSVNTQWCNFNNKIYYSTTGVLDPPEGSAGFGAQTSGGCSTFKDVTLFWSNPSGNISWGGLNSNNKQGTHTHSQSNTESISFDNKPLYLTTFFIIRIK